MLRTVRISVAIIVGSCFCYTIAAGLVACRATNSGARLESAIATPNGLAVLPAVDGDVMIKADETGLRITKINPAPNVGPQLASNSPTLCESLTYGGETGWRLLSKGETRNLISLKLTLVPGYQGNIWVQVTKKDRLDLLLDVSKKYEEAKDFADAHRNPRPKWDFFLMVLYTGRAEDMIGRFDAELKNLKDAVKNGHGGDLYSFAIARITEGDTTDRDNLTSGAAASANGVICAKD